MFGQGIVPDGYHPFVDTMDDTELKQFPKNVKADIAQLVSQQHLHHAFINLYILKGSCPPGHYPMNI